MTKNNAFKKTVRFYMKERNLSYTEALKILDKGSYLQGTGSITLIVGNVATGKTTAFRELLKSQTLPTAAIVAQEEEADYIRTTSHYVETLPYIDNGKGVRHHVDVLQTQNNIENLVTQKKYSLFAIEGIDYCANQGEDYLLDAFPRKADLILLFSFGAVNESHYVSEVLDYLDGMKLSREKLSSRVKLVKKAHTNTDLRHGDKNRYQVTDYHL